MHVDIELSYQMPEQIRPVYLLSGVVKPVAAQKRQKPLHADAETEDRAPKEYRYQAHNHGYREPPRLDLRHEGPYAYGIDHVREAKTDEERRAERDKLQDSRRHVQNELFDKLESAGDPMPFRGYYLARKVGKRGRGKHRIARNETECQIWIAVLEQGGQERSLDGDRRSVLKARPKAGGAPGSLEQDRKSMTYSTRLGALANNDLAGIGSTFDHGDVVERAELVLAR